MQKEKLYKALGGIGIGIANGLFGAGGGIIAVPVLKRCGLSQKESHANAVAVILPISILSGMIYLFNGTVELSDVYAYIPTGILGAVLGTVFLKKISPIWLKKIFGVFIIYAGVRLLLK